jgi:hypothetical protein
LSQPDKISKIKPDPWVIVEDKLTNTIKIMKKSDTKEYPFIQVCRLEFTTRDNAAIHHIFFPVEDFSYMPL